MEELLAALVGGAGWGVGIGIAVGAVAAAAGTSLRPVAKEAIKLGMTAGERVQVWTADVREQVEDLVAEAQAEAQAPSGEVAAGTVASSAGAAEAPSADTLVMPSGEPATSAGTSRRRRSESAPKA